MDSIQLIQSFQTFMQLVALVSVPPLVVAMAVGLIIAILQAATQIQDQTLPLTVKVLAVGFTLSLFGAALTTPLVQNSMRIFDEFPAITR
jgi:type III secretion protein S